MAIVIEHGHNGSYKSSSVIWYRLLPALRQGRLGTLEAERELEFKLGIARYQFARANSGMDGLSQLVTVGGVEGDLTQVTPGEPVANVDSILDNVDVSPDVTAVAFIHLAVTNVHEVHSLLHT